MKGHWCQRHDNEWQIRVHAQPGAKTTQVIGLHDGALKIRVAAPPIDGRANEALIAYVASCLGIAKSHVNLEYGANSREKRLRIRAHVANLKALYDG